MIKTLQKKFVVTAMTAITVLILLMLGAINIANIVLMDKEVDRSLNMLSEMEADGGDFMPEPKGDPRGNLDGENEDMRLSSYFFVVRLDENGQVIYMDVSHTLTMTEEEASKLAAQVYDSGRKSGRSGKYCYLVQDSRINHGKNMVFLDASGEFFSVLRVLLLSCGVGLVCWGLMLAFVIALSRKAICPIAENIEKQKQFVTNAGHEIKTPLAIIQSNTEAMELYIGENKWSRNIKDQTERLSGLMKNLLLLARMDEEGVKVAAVDFSLSDLLRKMAEDFRQPLELKGILMQTEVESGVFLHADRSQIEQLISILLDNAVKYTDEGGAVQISLRRREKATEMCIQNTCKNLPDVASDKLFDRFYRGDSARTQKSGGYGIGLSVARSIVEANKGTIRAEYVEQGSICFRVRF